MRFSFKQLQHFSVETVSGKKLGKVHDVIFELDGQLIVQYVVKSSLLQREVFLINREQIVRFETEKIIVDNTVRSESADKKKENSVLPNPEPVAMREVN